MRLSEAIRLGSLCMERPAGGDTRTCAIGMALLALGKQPLGPQEHGNQDYHMLISVYPWLKDMCPKCPWCCFSVTGTELIFHPFDWHVMDPLNPSPITIEQLCDWIATLEPEEAATEAPETVPELALAR